MKFDDLDSYVAEIFPEGGGQKPQDGMALSGDVLSGDWRIDQIDKVIQEAYDEAIWWHNNRIAQAGNPEGNPSGLRGVKDYIPFDEKIDGVNPGFVEEDSSYKRNGGGTSKKEQREIRAKQFDHIRAKLIAGRYQVIRVGGEWVLVAELTNGQLAELVDGRQKGWTCGDLALIAVVGFFCLLFMLWVG